MNLKTNSKILATLLILLTLLGPMMGVVTVQAAWTDPAAWYRTVPGVLAADYYKLYPFKTDKSLKLGFSQFGELINGIDNVGLEYRYVDPFAPEAGSGIPAGIPKKDWINGWLINISYTTIDGDARNVWACALHADLNDYAGPWLRVDTTPDKGEDPRDQGYEIGNYAGGLKYGGRKTNGTAVTEPYIVLYEGPRRFVALLDTTIYDHRVHGSDDTTLDIPLVRLLLTIIFNKDKKEVYILKDVKSITPKLTVQGKMYVQFSNRGEVDLGTTAGGFPSYAHFYTAGKSQGQPTPYDEDFVDTVKTVDPASPTCLGRSKWGPEPKATGTYDVAQVINFATDVKNVFFAAFWPSLSNYEIFGGAYWWRSLTAADLNRVDMPTEPHPTPFYIGEWDFELTDILGTETHFRGVTEYGVTDLWDGADVGTAYDGGNKIDSEVKYQLNETFTPWDLYQADPFNMLYRREVEFFNGDGTTKNFVLDYTPIGSYVDATPIWDKYCTFAERVLVGGVLQVPARAIPPHTATTYKYEIHPETSSINFTTAPPVGTKNIKVLYSRSCPDQYEWIIVGRDSAAVDSAGAAMVSQIYYSESGPMIQSGLDMQDTIWGPHVPFVMAQLRPGTATITKTTTTPTATTTVTLPYRPDYRNAVFKSSSGKTALKDDWCTTYAVSSASIESIGSPWANLLTEYWNEFTDAYLDVGVGEDGSVVGQFSGKIVSLSCWDKLNINRLHGSGYAVIATYKDLNGTIGLVVWGWTGDDTYFACRWLWAGGYNTLGTLHRGVTAIVLKISYTTCPYSASIVEKLGTITEYDPHPDP